MMMKKTEQKRVVLEMVLPRKRRRREVSYKFTCLRHFKDKKKKTVGETGSGGIVYAPRAQDNSQYRLLGDWKAEGKTPYRQTYPPTIPIT
jgi:hypothetical protein